MNANYLQDIKSLISLLEKNRRINVGGLFGPPKAFFTANLRQASSRTLLVVAGTRKEAEELYDNISFFAENRFVDEGPGLLNKKTVCRFPSWEILPGEPVSPHIDIVSERIEVLERLKRKETLIIISTIEALLQRVLAPEILDRLTLDVKTGDCIDRDRMISTLIKGGYKRTGLVEDRGEFSVRGGIVDIFPIAGTPPTRMEFIGEEVETIREFSPETQRSSEKRERTSISPARETVFRDRETIIEELRGLRKKEREAVIRLIERTETEGFFAGIEQTSILFHPLAAFFNYLPRDTVLITDIMDEFEDRVGRFFETANREKNERTPDSFKWQYVVPDEFKKAIGRITAINTGPFPLPRGTDIPEHSFSASSIGSYRGRFSEFVKQLKDWRKQGMKVAMACLGREKARTLERLLEDYQIKATFIENNSPDALPLQRFIKNPPVSIYTGSLVSGFFLSAERLVFVAEKDIFGLKKPQRYKRTGKEERFVTTFKELKEKDYIVHIDYGIGRYLGTADLETESTRGEFLAIEYAEGEKLYVPLDKLDRVQKYTGASDGGPRLDRLGDGRWFRLKTKVKKSLKNMARELLELYAYREKVKGFAFSPDSSWHREFDLSFEYEETEHQRLAIEDVKADMEQEKPMDRLICGDVGYGKTEVAMRAAFKAVMDGKQMAMLVPTTILAQQHLHTFACRFSPYPVSIEMISRFKTAKEQRIIIEKLKKGEVDIIIGTHRLLQKDVQFKNLGLIIIDEEQRFGVMDKERLKNMRKSVDVLTLTATPIPRTLYLSFSGIREMSVIDTPPEERLSIKTCVRKFGRDVIKEAISRELEREGQIFFVHNRVENIERIGKKIQSIVPETKIGIAHGQMSERELEKTMIRFLDKEFDMLLCTTIIESGLDIPSANTIIINSADKFGLAQLYQLRGRVGRDRHQAYAYLLVPPDSPLSYDSRKRLEAIQELSELGSGFRLATRDLEIRGAGNVLGTEQSGHIAAVGFELYCRLLKEAVIELKEGKAGEALPELEINININGSIPSSYIPETNERLEVYRKLASLKDPGELKNLRDETRDIYGDIPLEFKKALMLQEVKIMAGRAGIEKIERKKGKIVLIFQRQNPELLAELSGQLRKNNINAEPRDKREICVNAEKTGWKSILALIKKTLQVAYDCDTIEKG